MLEGLLALLTVVVLIAIALAYFELIDPLEVIAALLRLVAEAVRLIAGLVFAVGAFFVYLVKRGREKKS